MSHRTDQELIQALGKGDEEALRVLVDRHTASIYRFSVRYTGDESIAQDICQEVFLRLYRNARKYVPGMPFKTWLFTIVRNTSINFARLYTYRKAFSLDEHPEEIEKQSLLDRAPDPEERYLSRESAQKVAQAVQSLSERQRTAVILRYYEDMSIKEVAGIMKSTVSSVESLLVRAKTNLLKLLKI
jgi:RNA polymerase sigma-70 factor (ECF subfamily)